MAESKPSKAHVFTEARRLAEKYVKAEWQRQGIKLHSVRTSCCARRSGAPHDAHRGSIPPRQAGATHVRSSSRPQAHDGSRAHAVEPPAL